MRLRSATLAAWLGILAAEAAFAQATAPVIEPADCRLLSAADANDDQTSSAIAVSKMGRLSVWVSWASLTGSVDASFKVQVASTAGPPESSEWVDKTGAGFVLSGASGAESISITNLTERWFRVVYTDNSVSGGTITARCHAKGI